MPPCPAWLESLWPLPIYRRDPNRAHHHADGYRNLYPFTHPRFRDLLRWNLARRKLRPQHQRERIRQVPTDLAALHANHSRPSVTWIGHASCLIQLEGCNILLDPVWSPRASPLSWAGPARQVPPPMSLSQLPHIDLVLVTHNHYDHLDFATIRALARQPGGAPHCVVPLGVHTVIRQAGVPLARIHQLDWWQHHRHGGVEITLTPAHHWSKRWMLGDHNKALWGGFAIRGKGLQLWFPGDTGYQAQLFRDIGQRLGRVDFALLPIGAYEPRWFLSPQHVNPDEAVKIFQAVHAQKAWAVHWGTFILTDEALHQPIDDLQLALRQHGVSADDFSLPAIGETRWL